MRRKIAILILICLLVCFVTYANLVETEQQQIAQRLIRLHIVANSDSEADQADKLAVRDAVLPLVSELTAGCETPEDAKQALQAGLPALRACASQALLKRGCDLPVTVALQTEIFPQRHYDTFSLPAGQYETLRVRIGEAEGHNWWCVAFPSLCLPATAEGFLTAAGSAGLSDEQTALMTGTDGTVTLKFRLLDWLCSLFAGS